MNNSRRNALKSIAQDFLSGRQLPIETARALIAFEDDVTNALKQCIIDMVGVESETDSILVGDRRTLWHPEVRAIRDGEHDKAQAWAEPMVRETCERIAKAL